jgi:hypothetical protein
LLISSINICRAELRRSAHFASLFRIAFAGNANLMYYHLLEKGVFLWEGRVYALSTAHTDADLAHIIEAVKSSVDELREGGFLPAAAAGAPRRVVVAPQARAVAATPAVVAVARTETPAPRSQQADFSLSFLHARQVRLCRRARWRYP